MKDTYYFPHDYNAINDPKMMVLFMQCGISGVGMYRTIVEILHQQEDSLISYDQYKQYILFYMRQEPTNVEHVLIDCGLLFLENGQIGCKRVFKNKEKRLEISEKRSLAGKISAEKRQLYKETSTHVEQVLTSVEQNPTKERKGKEIKRKEIKEYDNIIKEETSTAIAVSDKKKSIVNKSNKDNALGMYNTIKELCTVVDGTLDDCVVLFSKVKLYQGDPPTNLGTIINKMRLHGLSEYYSTSSPKKLADNLGTIVEKIKLKEMQEAQKQEKLKGF